MDAVFVRDGHQWVRLPLSDILYIEADDNSTKVHTEGRTYLVARMMKAVVEELDDPHFERIHRSFAVNLVRVKAISDNGLHVGERWLPIGRSYRGAVLQRLRLI
ncbi:MAG: LytTR family transcriptional regulator [Flavobacteriales bacterium]|nr:LytTR family transcriptional regulator [Flavobacteriales bacterium]